MEQSDNIVMVASIVERLRAVREARRHFITLWSLESCRREAAALSHVAHDVNLAGAYGGRLSGDGWDPSFLFHRSDSDD